MHRRVLPLLIAATAALATVGVATAPTQSAAAGANLGSWSAPFTPDGSTSRVIGVHSVVLHDGKVLLFGNLRPTVGYVYDPATGKSVRTDPPADIECGGVVQLADGRVLVVGGHAKGNTGINNVLLFDPDTLTWTAQPPTSGPRYYPTTTLLPDGRVVISAGFDATGADNLNVDVYTPPPPNQSVGTLQKVGQHLGGLYPPQWVLPNGDLVETQRRGTYILNTSNPNTSNWAWKTYPKFGKHGSGEASVLLPGPPTGSWDPMVMGGVSATTAYRLTDTLNAQAPLSGWTPLAQMPEPRGHMQAVLTPNNAVVGIGGNQKANFDLGVKTALSYDRATNTWVTLAAQAERRAYHSTAVLLPSGKILSAGDTGAGGGGNTMETFSPPYLSTGSRPSITNAPTQVANGSTFTIATTNTSARAVLMAPGAATHTVDMHSRHVELATSPTAGGIAATVPSPNVAIPGYYMLFLVDSNGAPSVAKWVHVG